MAAWCLTSSRACLTLAVPRHGTWPCAAATVGRGAAGGVSLQCCALVSFCRVERVPKRSASIESDLNGFSAKPRITDGNVTDTIGNVILLRHGCQEYGSGLRSGSGAGSRRLPEGRCGRGGADFAENPWCLPRRLSHAYRPAFTAASTEGHHHLGAPEGTLPCRSIEE